MKRAPKFSKMKKYRRLKETGASYTQKAQKVVSRENDEIFGKNQANQEKLGKAKI